VVAETAVDVVAVSATFIPTREILASHGTIKTHGTARMAEVEITEDEDTTNLRTTPTLPQLKPRTIRMGGIRPKTIIRTINRAAGTGDRLSRRMTHGLRINSHPTEVVEEGTTRDMMVRTAAERMGTLEGEVALLLIEEVSRMAVGGMAIKEVKEGDMDMAVTMVDIISLRRTTVVAEVVTAEAAVIMLVEAINLADRTVLVSSPMGTEEVTTKEVVVVGEGTDRTDVETGVRKLRSGLLRPCFPPALS